MHKYTLSFICFLSICARVFGKSYYEYNVDPEHDLVAAEARSYSNFWPNVEYGSTIYHPRHRHHGGGGRGHAYGRHKPNHPHFGDFDSDEYVDSDFHSNFHHPPHHPHPHYGPSYQEPPRRFPPPPVYDKDFINPWNIETTPNPLIVPGPVEIPSRPMVPTKTTTMPQASTTTAAPPLTDSSTTNADGLIYDIDLRFGQ